MTDSDKIKKIHKGIVKHLGSIKGVHSVSEELELPNKYGDNVSHYSVKYDYEDKYNYSVRDFTIQWKTKTLFVRTEGYFPFKTFGDIKKIMSKYVK